MTALTSPRAVTPAPPVRVDPQWEAQLEELLTGADIIVINSSAGKDSMAMLAYLAWHVKRLGLSDRVVVIHNNLGVTDTGEPIEWHGVEDLAREHAAAYGFRFETTTRPQGGFWDQLDERGMWPDAKNRWCTGDQKTKQATKVVTRLVTELRDAGLTDRPVEVLYCLGLRAAESGGRAAKPRVTFDRARSNSRRRITVALPIQPWSVKNVWDQIKAAGLRPHAAYDWVTRLSCSLCVLASRPDLIAAARRRPQLVADYIRKEDELGHRFRADLSMRELQALAQTDRAAAGESAGAPEQTALFELAA
jgi:3'-phosphoadenosine 5'-phosphosulfate sulfotransferase (PAPS reductase)/FAD synthetase